MGDGSTNSVEVTTGGSEKEGLTVNIGKFLWVVTDIGRELLHYLYIE